MNATHTPGPWAVYTPNFNADLCWTVQTDSGMSVIVCGGDTAENSANARLISAAPELLEALRYMVENAEADGWSELMLSEARAAIAKADPSAAT